MRVELWTSNARFSVMNLVGKYILANVHFDNVWSGSNIFFVLNQNELEDMPVDFTKADLATKCYQRTVFADKV